MRLRATDWVVASLAAAAVFWLAVWFPFVAAPRFAAMFHDFGGSLPWLTRFALSRWLGPALAAPAAASLALGLANRRPLLLTAAFLLSVSGVGACFYAVYQPIWQLAGNVRAE